MQLDLFDHSRDVMLRNDVVAALQRRDPDASGKALTLLSAEFPQDALRTPLTELARELEERHAPFAHHDEALRALARMDTVIIPAAQQVFGSAHARHWLAPLWQSMAMAAQPLAFDPQRPRAHAAPMLLAAGDWTAAQAATERIGSWQRIPATLAWMAEARLGCAGLEAAWPFLIELAWVSSRLFGELARRLPDPRLRTLLQRFEEDPNLADQDADPAWFPAWLLIAEPSLLPIFRQTATHDNKPPEESARIVIELLISERQGGQRMDFELRGRLQALHRGLFDQYKSTR